MIDYIMSAWDEDIELGTVIPYIQKYLKHGDTLIVALDADRFTDEVMTVVSKHNVVPIFCGMDFKNINANFQCIKKHCTNPYIFSLCPDEIASPVLLTNIHDIISANSAYDALCIPRMNYGAKDSDIPITIYEPSDEPIEERIKRFFTPDTSKGYAWPDYQVRIVRNIPWIQHGVGTHSGIRGFRNPGVLPPAVEHCIYHLCTTARRDYIGKIYNFHLEGTEWPGAFIRP